MDLLRVPITDMTLAYVPLVSDEPVSLQVGVDLAVSLYKAGITTVDVGSVSNPWHFRLAHAVGSAVPGLAVMASCALSRPQITHVREALKTALRARIGLSVPTAPAVVRSNRWHSYSYLLERVADCTSFASRLGLEVDLLVECESDVDPIFVGRMAQHAVQAGARGMTLIETGSGHADAFTGLVEKVVQAIPEHRVAVRCYSRGSMATVLSMAAIESGAREATSTAIAFGEERVCPTLEALAEAGLFTISRQQAMGVAIHVTALLGIGHEVRVRAAASNMNL